LIARSAFIATRQNQTRRCSDNQNNLLHNIRVVVSIRKPSLNLKRSANRLNTGNHPKGQGRRKMDEWIVGLLDCWMSEWMKMARGSVSIHPTIHSSIPATRASESKNPFIQESIYPLIRPGG